jgi:hypothetical protein
MEGSSNFTCKNCVEARLKTGIGKPIFLWVGRLNETKIHYSNFRFPKIIE